MWVEWTPSVKDAGVAENIIEGADTMMELAMLAQRLEVLPAAVIPEGEIDGNIDDISVIGVAGEANNVSESDEAADSEDDTDVISVAARVQKIELSEQAAATPSEPHDESRV